MGELSEMLKLTTMEAIASYVQKSIDGNWQDIWNRLLPQMEELFANKGDAAYGLVCLKLFQPIHLSMVEAGLLPKPVLPGMFPQSVERWGEWDNRERRFWSVIHQADGKETGTLVTRVFHDHTRLRMPRPPQVYVVAETDPIRIMDAIIQSEPDVTGRSYASK